MNATIREILTTVSDQDILNVEPFNEKMKDTPWALVEGDSLGDYTDIQVLKDGVQVYEHILSSEIRSYIYNNG